MNTIKAQNGTEIFYKDWGQGQPIVFSHGWPLSSDAWDGQMLYFGQKGFRVIAHDRRGHGRSTATWNDNTMDQFADDLSALISELDLDSVILVGHSTGGGEVTRYIGRHGTSRVARLVLVGAIPPIMLKTASNPGGLPLEAFDSLRHNIAANRAQFFRDLSLPFYGYNREHAKESQGLRDSFWLQGMMGSIKSQYDSIKEFSESDFTEDLKKIDVPTLILHGEDDQIVPIGASALLSSAMVPKSVLKVYPGANHGLTQTHQDEFNADLLAFIKGH
ncbi:MAG TPA: alpha/beta hydrolase [Oligoflexus sp.]|uniref:alpha/beta fold hydrolase n=1 Tax=Oligoflexus sp. TaxID=1971216 RepID=UPI002D4754BB|nr:alpha/beta hydrolase [Oligoflexus sp.]HYX38799.1 alpha/beta hydrolase [Oligoflexus sp.]